MSLLKPNKDAKDLLGLYDFTNGIAIDSHFCDQEIKVQKAWIESLVQISLIQHSDAAKVKSTLDEAWASMKDGTFPWRIEDEDIHMNLERFVTQKLGELGKQIHMGRSRNDLIATTLRLFVRDCHAQLQRKLANVIETLCNQGQAMAHILIPGMTHLQHAQPIRFGHVLASYGWAFLRDAEKSRFAQTQAMSSMPLGSAALSGTTLSIDLNDLASRLGFESPSHNSYDSVGDRDFILLTLDVFAGIAMHLSRLAEDVIYGSSTGIGLIGLPENWSTGSSIMPNKRNPDIPELIRAKAAHILSAQTNAYVLMKGLPTSYDSDLHELKSVLLRSWTELDRSLGVLVPFLAEMTIDSERAQELLQTGHLLATEIANHLTLRGASFREAYAQTAELVRQAQAKGISVELLPGEEMRSIAPKMDLAWIRSLDYSSAVEARSQPGGTSLKTTLEGINVLRNKTKTLL